MGAIKRACVWLGAAALASMLVALGVMMFLFEAPQVATWFGASAALAIASFATALVAHQFAR